MTSLTHHPMGESRRAFLKTTGLASLATLAGTGIAKAAGEEVAPAMKINVAAAAEIAALPRITQKLVDPPFLPEHRQVVDAQPRVVEIKLPIIEKKMQIDDEGTEIWALTFNGTVPGPMIVVHEGDYVEVTLQNPATNAMEHTLDVQASTGALAYTFLQPGIYAYVNHNLIEAVMLGATAHVVVEGEWNDDLMTQVQKPGPIQA